MTFKSRYQPERAFLVQAVTEALERDGPMTTAMVSAVIGEGRTKIGSVLSRMNRNNKTLGRRVYIESWTTEEEGSGKMYPRAVYALGDKKNAPRPPKMSCSERTKRWRNAKRQRVSSVFDLAIPIKQRESNIKSHRSPIGVQE